MVEDGDREIDRRDMYVYVWVADGDGEAWMVFIKNERMMVSIIVVLPFIPFILL